MSMNICCINWEAVSAISNIVMAAIALASLAFSFYVLYRDRKQRIEDVRARINCSIVSWKDNYFLQIHNVGKETAYDIHIKVEGKPISENPYTHIKSVFAELPNKALVLSAGEKFHFMVSPGITHNRNMGIGDDRHTSEEINDWLKQYDEEKIIISGIYNNKYKIDFSFSIRDNYPIGT
ncbi:MAG: hypothetical protein J6O49_08075, partial [Bacteroidaceae bacterium]|nr:hypothetical protein [Bacteroidaceae bacterium]